MTPEQEALLTKAERAHKEAAYLKQGAFYETAVVRAYYGMFYLAQALLLNEGVSASSHQETISAFGRLFAKPERVPRELHRYLIQGQRDRSEADYDPEAGFTAEDIDEKLAQLEVFLEVARAFLTSQQSE